MRTLLLLAVLAAARTAAAGPYCGEDIQVAPARESTLPIAPTLGVAHEDAYYGGRRRYKAKPLAIRATIDGRAVKVTTRQVRGSESTIYFVKIHSKRTGTLALFVPRPYEDAEQRELPIAEYTIVKDWRPPATASATIVRGRDTRLSPYRRIGHLARVRVDAPAIAFSLAWRRDADDAWRTRPVMASTTDGDPGSEARLGQVMCGMVENVPLVFLERGIAARLTAWLPDGKTIEVALPDPFVLPPRDPKDTEALDRHRVDPDDI